MAMVLDDPLRQACRDGSIDEVRKLIAGGCSDINGVDVEGRSPIFWAAARDSPELVKLLAEKGADLSTADAQRGWSPLHWCAYSGKMAACQALLEAGADHSVTDGSGSTPLGVAANEGRVEAVQVLLEAGADPGAPDNRGNTPLHKCVKNWALHGTVVMPDRESGLAACRAVARALLAARPELASATNGEGKTPAEAFFTRDEAVRESILGLLEGRDD